MGGLMEIGRFTGVLYPFFILVGTVILPGCTIFIEYRSSSQSLTS
jgi:hypothetical protein